MVSYASQRYYLDTPFSGTLPEVLDVRARLVNEAMKIVAAERLTALAAAVARAAIDTEEARLYVGAHLVQCYCRDFIYEGFKASVAALIETARKEIQA